MILISEQDSPFFHKQTAQNKLKKKTSRTKMHRAVYSSRQSLDTDSLSSDNSRRIHPGYSTNNSNNSNNGNNNNSPNIHPDYAEPFPDPRHWPQHLVRHVEPLQHSQQYAMPLPPTTQYSQQAQLQHLQQHQQRQFGSLQRRQSATQSDGQRSSGQSEYQQPFPYPLHQPDQMPQPFLPTESESLKMGE